MNFKVEVSWNTEKYCRPPWLAEKKVWGGRYDSPGVAGLEKCLAHSISY